MKRIKYSSIVMLIAWLLVGTACNDVVTYNDGYDDQTGSSGPPSIMAVVDIADPSTPITAGVLAQMVVLKGDNLTGVKSITFNDVAVDMDDIYARRTSITVPVPRLLPATVNNLITVVTEKGTATTPFSINIPDLVITGFYNDYVMPGDTTMLVGANFDVYGITPEEGNITVNGTPLVIISAPDLYSLEVLVPSSVTGENLTAKVTGSQQTTPVEFKFRQCDVMLTDFTATGNSAIWPWGSANVTDGSNPGDPDNKVVGGCFARYQNTIAAWNDARLFDCMTASISKAILDDMENYELVFEILTKNNNPIKPGFRFEGNGNPAGTGLTGSDYWFPAGTSSAPLSQINTYEEWMTYRVPATYRFGVGGDAGARALGMVMFNRTGTAMDIDLSVANFRLVKKAQ